MPEQSRRLGGRQGGRGERGEERNEGEGGGGIGSDPLERVFRTLAPELSRTSWYKSPLQAFFSESTVNARA